MANRTAKKGMRRFMLISVRSSSNGLPAGVVGSPRFSGNSLRNSLRTSMRGGFLAALTLPTISKQKHQPSDFEFHIVSPHHQVGGAVIFRPGRPSAAFNPDNVMELYVVLALADAPSTSESKLIISISFCSVKSDADDHVAKTDVAATT